MNGFNDQTAFPNPDIFFRAVDRLQIESYLTSLRQDNKSLVLVSKYKELLTYYGERVVRRINQDFPQTSLEVLMPADTEGLLERFNAILNSLSFQVATQPTSKGMPDKIWLIQNANALGEKDIQILLKLIENFPGAGICAVLMFDASETESLPIFDNNPKINTWVLSLPTPEQKLNAIQEARRNGTEEIAIEFFNQLAKSEKSLSGVKAAVPDTSSNRVEKPEAPLPAAAPSSAPKATPAKSSKASPSSQKKILPWVIIVLGLLTISVGVSAVLHPEFGEKILSVFAAKSKNIKAVQSEDSAPSGNANEKDKTATTEIPEIALQGQRWLMKLPEDHFVLEFQTFATAQEAQKETEGKDWLKRTYVVPVRVEGSNEIKYMLVDGPFRTAEMAKKAASRMPNSSDIVIENVAGLRGYAGSNK
jgi:septal ring-binding cell division protein DamX